jgi:alpha-beta hydrolase superfamily lysophospholipase
MAVVEEQSFADIGVTHAEESFVNPRQFTIYTQSWIPANPVYVGTKSAQNWRTVFVLYANVMKLFGIWPPVDRATLILVHGLGEHSNRYLHFVRHLVQNSIAVYALDHEGTLVDIRTVTHIPCCSESGTDGLTQSAF